MLASGKGSFDFGSSVGPHICWTTKITPTMPTRSNRIISKARVQPQPPTVRDRRNRQLQINAPNDRHMVKSKLVVSIRDSSAYWFSNMGHHRWLRSCQNWLHQDRNRSIVLIQVVTVRCVIFGSRLLRGSGSQACFLLVTLIRSA